MADNSLELSHFCWRPRNRPVNDPENVDLIMFPGDARFLPYTGLHGSSDKSPTNGRIFALKFSSSSQRHLYWLQSPPHNADVPNKFSSRDLKIGELVDDFLQGDIPDPETIRDVRVVPGEDEDGGAGSSLLRAESSGAGGAGADATGGDIREEGEEAREGGADGGRA
jgi:26S proteasome regulatory subunit N13